MTHLIQQTTFAPASSSIVQRPSRPAFTLAAVVVGLVLAALSPAALAAWDLQQLMDSLAQTKSIPRQTGWKSGRSNRSLNPWW
jgi:hypothetical protein